MNIIWYNYADSTNAVAQRSLAELDNLSVIAAKGQTDGRGQRGNSWHSEYGKNLTFSLVLKMEGEWKMPADSSFRLSECVALAITDYLSDLGAQIKWPNDIYIGDRKICGILIENKLAGKEISSSIIGIGININQNSFPDSLPNPTSLLIERKTGDYDIENELEKVLNCLQERLLLLSECDSGKLIHKDYLKRLYRKDIEAEYMLADGTTFRGTIRDVMPSGLLCVEMPDGSTDEYGFKEIIFTGK